MFKVSSHDPFGYLTQVMAKKKGQKSNWQFES